MKKIVTTQANGKKSEHSEIGVEYRINVALQIWQRLYAASNFQVDSSFEKAFELADQFIALGFKDSK